MKLFHYLKKLNENQSLDYLSKLLLTIFGIVFILNCILSSLYLSSMKKQNLSQIESTLNIFTRALKQDLTSEERFLYWTVINDESLDDFLLNAEQDQYIKNLQKIRSHVQEFETYNKVDFSLFIQEKQSSDLINISPLHISYSEFLKIEDFFKSTKQEDYSNYNSWNITTIDQQHYIYKVVSYKEKKLYSITPIDAILKPLNEIEIGDNGSISVDAPQNTSLIDNTSFSKYETVIANKKATKLPFNIYVNIDYQDAFRNVLMLQFSILLLPLIISIVAFWSLFYTQKRVISPMKRLLQHLQGTNPEDFEFDKEGIIEIDDANNQINFLFNEIQMLKHDIFNAKLKQKSIELNYLKNQIHPHFYLNILSMIHGMIQTEHYEEIEQLTLSTSRYFRYLFQTDQDFVLLKDEIQHIQDYLQVQRLRYGNSFSFQVEIAERVYNNSIPPLILQIFVENIFKHCFSMDTKLSVRLNIDSVTEENDYYRIVLEDNGPGFPDNILSKLKSRTSLITKDGKHIGLTNTYERLDSLYQQDYYIHFMNKPEGGAMIKLILPNQNKKGATNENLTR
ncbi:TPA: sensor histidine kinase [Streptococcus suis]